MRSIATGYIYSQNPQQKVFFVHIFSCLIVLTELALQIANGKQSRQSAAKVLAQLCSLVNRNNCITLTSYSNSKPMENVREFVCNLRTLSHEHDCLANISTKEAFMLLLGKGNMLTRSNQRQKYMKKTLLLWILAVKCKCNHQIWTSFND